MVVSFLVTTCPLFRSFTYTCRIFMMTYIFSRTYQCTGSLFPTILMNAWLIPSVNKASEVEERSLWWKWRWIWCHCSIEQSADRAQMYMRRWFVAIYADDSCREPGGTCASEGKLLIRAFCLLNFVGWGTDVVVHDNTQQFKNKKDLSGKVKEAQTNKHRR